MNSTRVMGQPQHIQGLSTQSFNLRIKIIFKLLYTVRNVYSL
jgi:hypothetical protein